MAEKKHSHSGCIAPAEVTPEAALDRCPQHPNADYEVGFGLAGGGYGAYCICSICGNVFGKTEEKEDDDG